MSDFGGEIQGKSRLAVFEHVVEKQKGVSKRRRRYSDDSSQSESELIISDLPVPKKKSTSLKDEVLNLFCEWNNCKQNFGNFDEYISHIVEHSKELEGSYKCQWENCPNPEIDSKGILIRHLSFHGYLKKLQNIGDNIAQKDNLPNCVLRPEYKIKVVDLACQWVDCGLWFGSIPDYLYHVAGHINGVPSKSEKCDIACEWAGCTYKVSTRYKLFEHARVHSKERFLACSTCGATFVTKVTFSEHRKRQLNKNLRRYQCSQCLKLFPTERILSDHMRSHINQYKCTMCDMTSAKPSELAKHYRYRHIKDRPFKCTLCEKSFVAKCNLDTHLLTHQDKAYKCDMCSEGFKSKAGLMTHRSKQHSQTLAKYQCHVCKIYMSRGNNLTKHLMKKHKFHWPSGHSRFRYRKDQDGVCRLQTVRYESLEVTEEMIKSESIQKQNTTNTALTYHITQDSTLKDGYKIAVVADGGDKGDENENRGENVVNIRKSPKNLPQLSNSNQDQQVLIMIDDVDEEGQVINSQVVSSVVLNEKTIAKNTKKKSKKEAKTESKPLTATKSKQKKDDKSERKKSIASKEKTSDKSKLVKIEKEDANIDDQISDADSFSSSNQSQASVIATCDKKDIQVLKPIEFIDVKGTP